MSDDILNKYLLLLEQSKKDALTGCWNRQFFLDEFAQSLFTAQQSKTAISLVVFDIDNFKKINDNFGHITGDMVIQSLAETVRQFLGENSCFSRYGGDEFCFLLPGMEREEAFLLVERIRATIETTKLVLPRENRYETDMPDLSLITISAGIATYPNDGQTQDELLIRSDIALYRAKGTGRNKVRLAFDDKMVPKTNHFEITQLERLSRLAQAQKKSDAELLREALNDLLLKYGVTSVESSNPSDSRTP